ncbi:MAG: hypothetical protein M3P23_08730 [Actinomycetota bacterium]|nr:hypothetical protein [Actinomycetota bacterium]
MFVANERELLALLVQGESIVRITQVAGWQSRQVHAFASRQGYLFGADGIPYRPVYESGRRRAPR